jgi:DNA-directed RNA polymerase subunit beta'
VGEAYRLAGTKATVILCDKLKDLGFEYSTQAGITVGVKDLTIPLHQARPFWTLHTEVGHRAAVPRGYHHPHGKYNKVVDVWTKATNDVADAMMSSSTTLCPIRSTDLLLHPSTPCAGKVSQEEERCNSFNSSS